jgi:Carboxypeptidase regulatory-like domain
MKSSRLAPALLLALAACHPGPVVTTEPKLPVGGTIAGIVSSETKTAVVGRKVTAINADTGARYDATTGVNGGYTIKVPEGTYKIEIELQPGESISKQPGQTHINKSDLDPQRDFVIAGVKSGG